MAANANQVARGEVKPKGFYYDTKTPQTMFAASNALDA
jgi:hypothetical protein